MLTLAITGFDADPNAITEALGFEPTTIGRKGEPSASGRPRTFNGWWHEVEGQPIVAGKQHDDAMERILALLQGREDRFATLRTSIQPKQVTIYGGLHVPLTNNAAYGLSQTKCSYLLPVVSVGASISSLPANVRHPLDNAEPDCRLSTTSGRSDWRSAFAGSRRSAVAHCRTLSP